jgi:hypothetical protein
MAIQDGHAPVEDIAIGFCEAGEAREFMHGDVFGGSH